MTESTKIYLAVSELDRLLTEGVSVTLIDARTFEEYEEGHVPGAINVPIANLSQFAKERGETNEDVIVTMCGSTGRGEKAATILDAHSARNVRVLKGGLKAWRDAGLPVV